MLHRFFPTRNTASGLREALRPATCAIRSGPNRARPQVEILFVERADGVPRAIFVALGSFAAERSGAGAGRRFQR